MEPIERKLADALDRCAFEHGKVFSDLIDSTRKRCGLTKTGAEPSVVARETRVKMSVDLGKRPQTKTPDPISSAPKRQNTLKK